MKSIRWIFPIIIIVMAIILWKVYLNMPQNNTAAVQQTQQEFAQLHSAQKQLNQRIEELQMQISQANHTFGLPQAYYYLNMADMHLFVLKDVKTALYLMKWTQKQLKEINAPAPLQEAIAGDITELGSAAVPHVQYIVEQLTQIKAQVQTLPLQKPTVQTPKPAAQSSSQWKQALSKTWEELKSLIRIQPRNTSMDYVLFDETILRETVEVELEHASIAAVIGQTELYQASLQQAQLALQQFFAQDAVTQQVLAQLQGLAQQKVVPDVPHADRALKWLQMQEQQGSAPQQEQQTPVQQVPTQQGIL